MLINVIGCGKEGRSLCQLWREKSVFDVLEVVNQTVESTDLVISMMGLGSAVILLKCISCLPKLLRNWQKDLTNLGRYRFFLASIYMLFILIHKYPSILSG